MKRILIIIALFCCIDLFAGRGETPAGSPPYTVAGSYKFLDMTMGAYDTHALYALTAPFTQSFDSLWLPSIIVFNHEYFGHGYRAREFDVDGYPIVTPVIGFFVTTSPIPNDDADLLITGGGLESDFYAYRLFRERFLMSGSSEYLSFAEMHRGSGFLYILLFSPFWGDPYMYSEEINRKYNIGGRSVTIAKNYLGALWMLLDPWTLPSLPVVGSRFESGKYFRLGEAKFLYGTNYYLTPYGGEYDLDLCFLFKKAYHQLTLRYGDGAEFVFGGVDFTDGSPRTRFGDGAKKMFGGAGWRGRRIISIANFLHLGGEINGWYEPEYNEGKVETKRVKGGCAALQTEVQFGKTSLEIEGGYKTQGFLPGRGFKEEYFGLLAFNANLNEL